MPDQVCASPAPPIFGAVSHDRMGGPSGRLTVVSAKLVEGDARNLRIVASISLQVFEQAALISWPVPPCAPAALRFPRPWLDFVMFFL